MTTAASIFCLDAVGYYKYIHAITMSDTKQKATEVFMNIPRFAWERIPERIRPHGKYDTRTEIDLSGIGSSGGKYTVSCDAKGTTNRILHISEAGYFQNPEKILDALNVLPQNGICIMESTAHGIGNFFEQTFTEAWKAKQAGKNHTWDAVFFPWYKDPTNFKANIEGLVMSAEAKALKDKLDLTDNQVFFWQEKRSDFKHLVYQYFPSEPHEAFIHSGRAVFHLETLHKLKKEHKREPVNVFENCIHIYELPKQSSHYGIGVDSAEGLASGDNSVISVVDQDGKQVCEVVGKHAPHILVRLLARVCREYKNHLCVIENNSIGIATVSGAKEHNHINLYREKAFDKISARETSTYGFKTTAKSKPILIQRLNESLSEGHCIPRSVECFDELNSFVYSESGKMEAMSNHHDDRVMALALANLGIEEYSRSGGFQLSNYGII